MTPKPNPAFGSVILLIGAVVLSLISFSAVSAILIGSVVMLGIIWIIFSVLDGRGN